MRDRQLLTITVVHRVRGENPRAGEVVYVPDRVFEGLNRGHRRTAGALRPRLATTTTYKPY